MFLVKFLTNSGAIEQCFDEQVTVLYFMLFLHTHDTTHVHICAQVTPFIVIFQNGFETQNLMSQNGLNAISEALRGTTFILRVMQINWKIRVFNLGQMIKDTLH